MPPHNLPLHTLKDWSVGTYMNEPVMVLKTWEGGQIAVMMPPEAAARIGQALAGVTAMPAPKANN